MTRNQQPAITMEVVTDPEELAQARVQDERYDRNWSWFSAHAAEFYSRYRGKCLCIAGQELFVGDSIQEVLDLAQSAHPEDNGRFTRLIPLEKAFRIYAH